MVASQMLLPAKCCCQPNVAASQAWLQRETHLKIKYFNLDSTEAVKSQIEKHKKTVGKVSKGPACYACKYQFSAPSTYFGTVITYLLTNLIIIQHIYGKTSR